MKTTSKLHFVAYFFPHEKVLTKSAFDYNCKCSACGKSINAIIADKEEVTYDYEFFNKIKINKVHENLEVCFS